MAKSLLCCMNTGFPTVAGVKNRKPGWTESRGVQTLLFYVLIFVNVPEKAVCIAQNLLPYCGFSRTISIMMTKVLFVCMGNICRSPSAEGVFRHLIDEAGLSGVVEVDSAATHNFHIGEAPDARAQAAARKRGYDISACVARQITADDFREFDFILVMDWENLSALQQQCPKIYQHKLMLLMRFANEFEEATVPEPYYGGPEGFAKVLDYLEDSCQGVLEVVRKRATQYQAA
ncbi:protein tyrosine phosphatase [Eoetvoesiella caeni]|uniref:protein-tyrosine-phosphatase n=2 Tax=Eoetvoesiella caeni TaxID=645616 RepID=A0A366HEC0_9BURK|nr:protein tyrosine phosphatase [Eoetvoesiella caeni]